MDKVTALYTFLAAHWPYISAVVVLVVTALMNHNVGNPTIQTLWHVILDVLAPKVQAGASARMSFMKTSFKTPMGMKLPLLMRSQHGAATVKESSGPVAPSLIFLILMSTATGCPFGKTLGKCELNALPQTSQSVEACVVQAASGQGDVMSTITACGVAILPGQFNCVVQAVLAWAKGSIPPTGQAAPDMLRTIQNLQAWVAAHPTKAACGRTAL